MKKYFLLSLTLLFATTQIKPSHSGAAVAGGVLGGVATGIILTKLFSKGHKNPDVEEFKKESNKEKKAHQKSVKKHKEKLKQLTKDGKENTDAAKHERSQIQHHESIIDKIEQELRDFLKGHAKTEKHAQNNKKPKK